MKLKVITPDHMVVAEEAIEGVSFYGPLGSTGILPGHAPLVSTLEIAPLFFEKEGRREPVAVMGGVVQVQADEITVLSSAAERTSEIDAARASQAKERAEAYLTQKQERIDLVRAEAALKRALLRLHLLERASHLG